MPKKALPITPAGEQLNTTNGYACVGPDELVDQTLSDLEDQHSSHSYYMRIPPSISRIRPV